MDTGNCQAGNPAPDGRRNGYHPPLDICVHRHS